MGRSNPSQHVKDLVDARDQYRCVRCGKPFHWSGFNDHPELVPILTAQHGWVLLDDKGGWTRCEPPKQ